MPKRVTSVSDFAVAPRKPRPEPQSGISESSAVEPSVLSVATDAQRSLTPNPLPDLVHADEPRAGRLISPDEDVRRERSTTRAIRQETSRLRLQDLKQNKARESKHFVNCPLDFDTKQRLARAATENGVKMTIIIKTAIDQYLRDNGY